MRFYRYTTQVLLQSLNWIWDYVYCISAPLDYRTPSPTTVVFTPGSTRQSVSIPIQDDDIDEPLENFIVSLTLQSAPDDSVEVEPDEAEVSIGDADSKFLSYCEGLQVLPTIMC